MRSVPYALLANDAKGNAGLDAGDHETGRVGAELEEGEPLAHGGSIGKPWAPIKLRDGYVGLATR